ncbi:MAG: hydantoinase B/oxoprolinase family protein [Bacillota bacterium]|nr:hydantoinase B/oxoprolinase family protein [Bacillota bacterium]
MVFHQRTFVSPFAYYETIGGGMGANDNGPGESAVHSHMTNTLNTPVEAMEYAYPFLVQRYAIRGGSGGRGKHEGGHGIVGELKLLNEAEVTVLSERRVYQTYGLKGGKAGTSGKNIIIENGQPIEMPGKFNRIMPRGSVLCIETPGGGGVQE